MIQVADVGTLKREQTQWRNEIKRLNTQLTNLMKKMSDAQKEYADIAWAINQIQLAKKKTSNHRHNKTYYARGVNGTTE